MADQNDKDLFDIPSMPEDGMKQSTQNNQQQNWQQQSQQSASSSDGLSGLDFLSTIARKNKFTLAGGTLKDCADNLEKAAAQQNDMAIKIAIIDQCPNIPSMAIYTVENGVIYYSVLLLEALSKEVFNVSLRTPNGINYVKDVFTRMYWDETMERVVPEAIRTHARLPLTTRAEVCSVTTIKRTLNLADERVIAGYYFYAVDALAAGKRCINGLTSSPLKLSALARTNNLNTVLVHNLHAGETEVSLSGEIYASDFDIKIIARPKTVVNPMGQLNLHAGTTDNSYLLSSVCGYMDFDFIPEHPQSMYSNTANQPLKGFIPKLVITDNDTKRDASGANPIVGLIATLLGLSSITQLASRQNWYTIYVNDVTNGKKASVGSMWLQHNPLPWVPWEPGARNVVPGNSSSGSQDLMSWTVPALLNLFCYDFIRVCFDIPHDHPLYYINSTLAYATPGSVDEKRIIDELDYATDGAFSRHWDRSQSIMLTDDRGMVMSPTDIHLGHYENESGDGKLHDIRSLGYLEMLSALGKQNDINNIMFRYTQGYQPGTFGDIDMHDKREVLLARVPSVVITGTATRVWLNVNFLMAIEQAMLACDLDGTIEGLSDIAGRPQVIRTLGSNESRIEAAGVFKQHSSDPRQAGGPYHTMGNRFFHH